MGNEEIRDEFTSRLSLRSHSVNRVKLLERQNCDGATDLSVLVSLWG